MVNKTPVISETGLIAWYAFEELDKGEAEANIHVFHDGKRQNLTRNATTTLASDLQPRVEGNRIIWASTSHSEEMATDATWSFRQVAQESEGPAELDANYVAFCEADAAGGSLGRQWFDGPDSNTAVQADNPQGGRNPSGKNEIFMWDVGGETIRITRDGRNDIAPDFSGELLAWQKAKGWPFGWEIMMWDNGFRNQLTTNYYYDMAPRVHNGQIVWYGWDGQDYEVYLYDRAEDTIVQVTSNHFDDVSPIIYDGVITWEAYAAVEADVFMWKNGQIQRISSNLEDDVNPRIWNKQIVWQGFDGDDFEIYYFDGEETHQITDNDYDDLNPDIGEELIVWMGYQDNWDSEIFVRSIKDKENTMLTDNDYEDRDAKTAGSRVVWQATDEDKSMIFLAEPK